MFFADHEFEGQADSFYFGGGTPSIVPEEHLGAILEMCCKHFTLSSDCEISLEANPGSLTSAKVDAYRRMGVNRISVGAQCFDDLGLASIGRDHTAAQIEESLALLADHRFQNVNLDLMLGLPGQTRQSWIMDLEKGVALAPSHVSVYMLDLDPQAPLFHHVAKGNVRLPEDDLEAEAYLSTLDFMAAHDYVQYEISNFARPGLRCRHNLKYWLRQPVLAFGVGSHSYDGHSRYANYSNLNTYLKAVEAGSSPVEWGRPVAKLQALQETLFLSLRLNQGLDWADVTREFDGEMVATYECHLRRMSDEGLTVWNGSRVCLTPRGMLLSNEVFQNFV